MKKHLQRLLLLAAMLLVPWVTQAQSFSYSCNFEGDNDTAGWVFVNGSQTNKWFIDTATNNGGTKSLYISNNNGTSNAYTNSTTTFVYAYQEFTLQAGSYAISYDWKCNGESNYDYLRVFLAPATFSPTAGQDPTGGTSAYSWSSASLPSGFISLSGANKLNLQSSWQNYFQELTVPSAGTYRLVFAWANDGSSGTNPPAAVDNIQFLENTCPRPSNLQFANIHTTSVDVHWTEGGTATSWVVEYDTVEFTPGTTGNAYTETSDSISLTDLLSGYTYYFAVHADCGGGDTSLNVTGSVTLPTAEPVSEFPWTCNFTGDGALGWSLENGTQTNQWYIGAAAAYDGTGDSALYISDNSGTSNSYTVSSTSNVYAARMMNLTAGQYGIQFNWRCYGESSYDYIRAFLVPASAEYTAGTLTTSGTGWIDLIGGYVNQQSTWQVHQSVATIPSDGSYKLLFLWHNDASSGTAPPAAIDNIYINQISCPQPTSLVCSTAVDSLTFSWTAGGTETSWLCVLGTDTTLVTDTTILYTDLTPNTAYDFCVAAVCEDTSFFTCGTYRTDCPTYITLPFTEDFESYSTGSGNQPSCWTVGGYSSYPYVMSYGGSNALYAYLYNSASGTNRIYMSLPAVDTLVNPITGLSLYFDAMRTTTSTSSNYEFDIVVGVCGTAGDLTTFIPVDTVTDITNNSNTMTSYEVSLAGYSDTLGGATGMYVTLVVQPHNTSSSAYSYCAIDNIMLANSPTCMRVLDLRNTGITSDSVYLAWSDTNSSISGWYVEYGPAGFAHGDDNSITVYVTDSTAAIGDLTPDTEYDFYVAADCGSDDTSYWRQLTLHTACVPVDTLPYIYGFEDGFSSCWTKYSSYSTSYPQISGTACSGSSSLNMYNYSSNGGHCYAAMPLFNHQLDSLQVKFRMRKNSNYSYSYYSFDLKVGVMTNPTDMSTFETVETFTATSNTDWDTFTCYLSSYTGTGRYIAFMDGGNSSQYYTYVLLDDVEVDFAPECGPVEAVDVYATPYNALITWTPSSVGEYNSAIVGVYDTALAVWTYDTVTGTSTTFTGLTPETYYQYTVINVCSEGAGMAVTGDFTTAALRCGTMVAGSADTVVTGTGTSQTSGVPVNSSWGNTFCQSIFTAAELNALGVDSGTFNAIDYTWTNNSTYAKEFTILMGTTSDSVYTGTTAIDPATHTQVYHGDHPVGTNGTVHYDFDATFHWNGTDNLVITSFMNQPTGASHSSSGFYGMSTNCGATRTVYAYQDGTQYTVSNYTSGNSYNKTYRPTVTLYSGICESFETCVAPLPVVSSVTPYTATLQWAPGNSETSWSVYYAPASETTFTYAGNATTNEYTVTGLNQGSNYQFMVVALCGDDSNSAVCEGTTECAMITSFPFFEDFNSWGTGTSARPNCWTRESSYSNYPYISGSYNASGVGGALYFYLYNNDSNYTRMTAPEIDTTVMPIRNLQVYFQALQAYASYVNNIEIGVMVDPTDMTTFRPIDTVTLSGLNTATWYDFEVPLDSYTETADTGAFVTVRANTTSNYTYFYLDDFTLEQIPTCQRPDSLVLDSVTTTSFTCHWRDRASANEWIVEWGPRGFEPGTGTMVSVTSNPATINGVPASYNGDFYVYALCSTADTSPASRHACAFDTRQIPATIPYTYDFEDGTEWANWQTSSNIESVNWYRGTAMAYDGSYGMYVSADTGATFGTNATTVVNLAAYRDIDFGTVDSSYDMTFRYWVGGDNAGRYDGMMVFLVDPDQPVIASSANITSPWGNVNNLYRIADVRRDTNWNEYHAIFDTISGVHRVAFFWFNQNRSSYFEWGPAAVDSIHIDYSPCPRPLNLDTAGVTSTTANLVWDGPSSADYRVCYRVAGASASTNQYATSTTNSITLTGLSPMTSYYAWVQKICGSDSSLFSDGVEFQTAMCDNSETFTIGSPSSSGTAYNAPVNNFYKYTLSETIIDSAEIGGPMDIEFIGYYYDYSSPMTDKTNCTIYFQPTTLSTFASSSDVVALDSTAVMVYTGALNCEQGWNFFALDTVYSYDGLTNLMIIVDDNSNDYNGSSYIFRTEPCTGNKTLYYYSDSNNPDPDSPSSFSGSKAVAAWRTVTQLVSCGGAVSCPEPIITSVAQDYHSATVTWTGDGTDYEVNIKEASTVDWPATDIAVSGTTYTFNGLSPETDYTFRVRQVCDADSGDYSEWVIDAFTTDSLPCLAPEGLAVSDVTNAQGTFSWIANGTETQWDLHVWASGILDTTYRVTTNPATVGGFTAGVTYNAAVRAICGTSELEGDYSETISFTTLTCPDVTGLTTSDVTANSVTLSWTADDMATSWIVEYGYTGFAQGTGTSVTVSDNTYVVNDLEDETAYDFYVKAVCGDNWNSEEWTSVSATTLAGGSTEGIDDVIGDAICTIYPNPTSESTTISVSGVSGQVRISVVDMNGRTVASETLECNSDCEKTMDVDNLAQGAYFVKITGENVNMVKKLIVR